MNLVRNIKNDLLNVSNKEYKSNEIYHEWINQEKQKIYKKNKFQKDNLIYDLKANPFDYFLGIIYMMKKIEEEDEKIYNIFILRNEIIPKHIKLDTKTILELLYTEKHKEITGKYKTKLVKKIENNKELIWSLFFKTNDKVFNRKGYEFYHMIQTDGISCSILYTTYKIKQDECKELYIDKLNNYKNLKGKNIVAIDPGKCDLIFCTDNKDKNKFRYSQNQRRKETKIKKYSKLILKFKEDIIDNKNIKEWETELSKFNKKTLDENKFKEYIRNKLFINNKIIDFYKREIFRKLNLNTYINTKRSERNMLNKFIEKFGSPENTIICFGDWEQKKQMKFKEPTIGKGMRTLFRREGYQVYLVDEFRTSCMCSNCQCEEGKCEKFLEMHNPRP